jgi:hypothetical protein
MRVIFAFDTTIVRTTRQYTRPASFTVWVLLGVSRI